jgi:hypothetical protein
MQCHGIIRYGSSIRTGSSRWHRNGCRNGSGAGIAARGTIATSEAADHDGTLSGTERVDNAPSANGTGACILLLQSPGEIKAGVLVSVIESRLPPPEWVSERSIATLHPCLDRKSACEVVGFNVPGT